LVGVAVNVTLVPLQITPEGEAAMLTLAGSSGFTVMVIAFEVAGDPEMQEAFDVITTVITSPFDKVDEV
jgi:hypothetical protein